MYKEALFLIFVPVIPPLSVAELSKTIGWQSKAGKSDSPETFKDMSEFQAKTLKRLSQV